MSGLDEEFDYMPLLGTLEPAATRIKYTEGDEWAPLSCATPRSTVVNGDPAPSASSDFDPHLHFAHGGKADFRGRNGVYYNFFSAPNFAVNLRTDQAIFVQHGSKTIVNGSFFTEAHVVARVGGGDSGREWANVSLWGLPQLGGAVLNGTCGATPFALTSRGYMDCHDLAIRTTDFSAFLLFRNWSVTIGRYKVHRPISGPAHRLDVSFSGSAAAAERALPHGIIGQSFASKLPLNGKQDKYPSDGSRFTTSAMGEGALEGTAAMYEVPSSFATDFAFSRFRKAA